MPTIRPMQASDVTRMYPLLHRFQQDTTYRDCIPTSFSEIEAILNTILAHPESYVSFVALQGESIIGFCMGSVGSAHAFLPNVRLAAEFAWWVEKAHRDTSLGAKLLARFREWGIAHGATLMSYGRPLTSRRVKPGVYREEIVRMQIGEPHV